MELIYIIYIDHGVIITPRTDEVHSFLCKKNLDLGNKLVISVNGADVSCEHEDLIIISTCNFIL